MNRSKHRIWNTGKELFQRFEQSNRLKEAEAYLSDESKLQQLLKFLPLLFRQRALAPILKDLIILYHYIKDVKSRRYLSYNPAKLILIVALIIYVVSPFDFVPDWIPGAGFLDDAAIVSYAMNMLDKELQQYFRWYKSKRNAEQQRCDDLQ